MLFWRIYVKKKQKFKSKFQSIIILNRSARLTISWKECIRIIIHVWLIFKCKFNVLEYPSSPQRCDMPHL